MASMVIGVLTAGGDCPGLNAAIRAVGKAAHQYDMEVIGFLDGFTGLVESRTVRLDMARLSGILTAGGTILGTSRDKPHKMPLGNGESVDMTPRAVANYERLHLDALVCMGGNGTQKNAYRLAKQGLNIITLPKTIDNDVAKTDTSFGYDTAMTTAAEAIDRLHSTADSHHRVMVVEIMGHAAGWLPLGAGIAGGADVVLLPELPYSIDSVVESLLNRYRNGKRFSIVAIAEGARSLGDQGQDLTDGDDEESDGTASAVRLAEQIRGLTTLDTRVTVLGHLQRGGSPTPTDRLLATRLGTRCAELIEEGTRNVMVAVHGDQCDPVPLEDVAGRTKQVPLDHSWITSARLVGTCFGD
jgi:6-phosphofructokinase 1